MEYRNWPIYPEGEAPAYQSGPCITYTREQIARINAQPPQERADDRRRYMVPSRAGRKRVKNDYPKCVLCGSQTYKNGKRDGVQMYRCNRQTCNHQQTEGSTAVGAGRPRVVCS